MRLPLLPLRLYLIAFLFAVGTGLLHWLTGLDRGIVFYFIGALIGLHIFQLTEQFIVGPTTQTVPVSPLKNLVVQLLLLVVAFFVLSSTGSAIGAGIVLFLNLQLLYLQYETYTTKGNLFPWFTEATPHLTQVRYLYGIAGLFLIETLLFILV